MDDLNAKLKLSLDESRILVLGAQILVGFQYRLFLEAGYSRLPFFAQVLQIASLGVLLIGIALMIAPVGVHQISEKGENNRGLISFSCTALGIAFLPFLLALGADVFVAVLQVTRLNVAAFAGGATAVAAAFFWYGWEFLCRAADGPSRQKQWRDTVPQEQDKPTELKDKIDHVLTESRVVIPGAQALLGFQFIAMMTDEFARLPAASKWVHLTSLLLMAAATILLMTPASFHRLVERGENTERFYRFTRRILLASMIPLAAGMAGDFYVVVKKVADSQSLAILTAGGVLAAFYATWFGYPLYRRARDYRSCRD